MVKYPEENWVLSFLVAATACLTSAVVALWRLKQGLLTPPFQCNFEKF